MVNLGGLFSQCIYGQLLALWLFWRNLSEMVTQITNEEWKCSKVPSIELSSGIHWENTKRWWQIHLQKFGFSVCEWWRISVHLVVLLHWMIQTTVIVIIGQGSQQQNCSRVTEKGARPESTSATFLLLSCAATSWHWLWTADEKQPLAWNGMINQ